MRKISICIMLGSPHAMLRMLISVHGFCFFGQYLVIVLIRTDFTTPASRMFLRRIMNRRCFLPRYKHTRFNYYAFNCYARIKSRSMSSEAQTLLFFYTYCCGTNYTSRGLRGVLQHAKHPPVNPPCIPNQIFIFLGVST